MFPKSPAQSSYKQERSLFSYIISATLISLLAVILAFYCSPRLTLPRYFSRGDFFPLSTIQKNKMATNVRAGGNVAQNLEITKRPWNQRGHADHGWLYTYHTFSFAHYYDPSFESFGPLRVINEDRVERGTGFGTHSHAEFLIWSYIVSGELEHKDSMGNLENLKRGEVQFTNAGTGIRHSEYNRNKQEEVHFLQIWAKPSVKGLKPSYKTQKFTDKMKENRLLRIMESVDRHSGQDGEGQPIPMHADLSMSASILDPGKKVAHEFVKDGPRNVYLHVVMTDRTQPKAGGARIKVGDVELGEGDGAFIRGASGPGKLEIESVGEKSAEFLLFDMGQ